MRGIDVMLIGIAGALFAIGAVLLWLSPAWWGCYLRALDVQVWPAWKVFGLIVVLADIAMVVHYWPDKERR